MFHYFQNLSHENQFLDDFHSQMSNACLISGIPDYDFRAECDLLEVPEQILEQPLVTLDHMTSAMSMILCEEEVMSQEIKYTDIGAHQKDDFMSNFLYEYKDILAEETLSPSDVMNFELPATEDDDVLVKENFQPLGKVIKSVSSDSLSYVNGAQIRPSYVDLTEMELNEVHGMRRAFSEGYIKPQLINGLPTETRMQKLSRYRDKKTKRNFCRKIKEGISGWPTTDQRKVC